MKKVLSIFFVGLIVISAVFSAPFTANAYTHETYKNENGTMQYDCYGKGDYYREQMKEDFESGFYEYDKAGVKQHYNSNSLTTPDYELYINNYDVNTYGNDWDRYYCYRICYQKCKVKVSFYIDVEPGYDFVEFYDSDNNLLQRYSYRDENETKLQTLTFEGNSFKFRMITDHSNTQHYKGFRIESVRYSDDDFETEYSSILEGREEPFLIYNNNKVLAYKNNLDEYYNYYVRNAEKIKLDFYIDVEQGYDFVEFYDMSGNLIKRYSAEDPYKKKLNSLTIDGNSFQIRLISDRSNTQCYYGFKIEDWVAYMGPAVKNLNSSDYTLVTPKEDYPESPHEYSNYANLTYAYRYPNAKSLKVKFSDQCKTEVTYDTITVCDEQGNTIGTYSGTQLSGKTLDIPTGSFSIKLQSDRSKTFYGFSIDSIEATMASNPLYTTGRYGEAYSNEITPRTAHSYANNANETYYYTDANADSIDLQFDKACKTEKNWDFITIYDKNGKQIAKLSGDQASNKFIHIPGNSFGIKFTSDKSKTFYGYSLFYVSPNYGKAHEGNNVYAYPESGHNYDNYANQTYKYVCPYDHVQALDLAFSDKCMTEENYDIVSVYDKNNNLIGSYSGKMLSGKRLTVPGNEFTIKFKTDRSRAYYGFSFDEISVRFDQELKITELHHDYALTQIIENDGTCEKVYACKNCQDVKKNVNLNFERLDFIIGDNVFKYDGKDGHKPSIVIKDGNKVLNEGEDYTLSYTDTKNYGTQKMTVNLLNEYEGKKEFDYIIYKNEKTELSLLSGVTGITANVLNPVENAKYEVLYSQNADFSDAQTDVFDTDSVTKAIPYLKTDTTYYVKARYKLEINGKNYYSDYGNTFIAKTGGTYDELTNLNVNTVDEIDKAWGMNATWDKVPKAEGYQILIKEWDYDWVNSKYDYEKCEIDNSHPTYTDSDITNMINNVGYGNNISYSSEVVEDKLPSATKGNMFAYDYYENFYYDGVGYYTTNNYFKTLTNMPDDRRFTISVRPVFENGTVAGDWIHSDIIRTKHKYYSSYGLVNQVDKNIKTSVINILKQATKEIPAFRKTKEWEWGTDKRQHYSDIAYKGNIEFVDLSDYMTGDVQLQNIIRSKTGFLNYDGINTGMGKTWLPLCENPSRAKRTEAYYDITPKENIEYCIKDFKNQPWVPALNEDGSSNNAGGPDSSGVFYYAFKSVAGQAKAENWSSMTVYYYWSEIEGAINFNFVIAKSGSDQDVIGEHLKNVRNVNI